MTAVTGCCLSSELKENRAGIRISLEDSGMTTRAGLPDEGRISHASIMVFDSRGELEWHTYMKDGRISCNVNLLKNKIYSIYACINFGYDVKVSTVGELEKISFYLTYPDEYREGLPMVASRENILITDDGEIKLELVRLMSRISLKMDRSLLSEGVSMNVTGVRIGNCPKRVKAFGSSRIVSEDECFRVGFSHDDQECRALNVPGVGNGISQEISLYMLENMQGRFSDGDIGSDQDKVLGEYDPRSRTCSYIEIEMDYSSGQWSSGSHPLIYRFYLGEDRNWMNVERNCHYRITVCPENDGLKDDGWRVDKTGLTYSGDISLEQFPSGYIMGNVGDKIHVGCIVTPAHAPFDIGEEYMKADKNEGIYDYSIDPDGHGATLTFTGPGRGLIYMEAGEPVNDAALFVIEVNRP